MSTGPLQSSIKSVSTLASSAKTTAGGLKSNNGIENSKSAIEGKERSEAILESMFAFGIEHAQEFAQRELDDDLRWWKQKTNDSMIANMSAQKSAAGAQALAGMAAAGLAGIGGGIAALASKKDSNESNGQDIKENQKSNNVQKLTQNDPKDKDKIQEINQEGQTQSQQHNLVAQSETDTWQSQDFQIKDARDPDNIFS